MPEGEEDDFSFAALVAGLGMLHMQLVTFENWEVLRLTA
jgi:hypothetical protein